MDSSHIFRVGIQKVVAVNTELKNHLERWWVVIIKRIVLAHRILVKVAPVILSLRAKVINLVMLVMFLTEESLNISDAIAVHSFCPLRRKSHSDYLVSYVA